MMILQPSSRPDLPWPLLRVSESLTSQPVRASRTTGRNVELMDPSLLHSCPQTPHSSTGASYFCTTSIFSRS